jgi:hypothetical protein
VLQRHLASPYLHASWGATTHPRAAPVPAQGPHHLTDAHAAPVPSPPSAPSVSSHAGALCGCVACYRLHPLRVRLAGVACKTPHRQSAARASQTKGCTVPRRTLETFCRAVESGLSPTCTHLRPITPPFLCLSVADVYHRRSPHRRPPPGSLVLVPWFCLFINTPPYRLAQPQSSQCPASAAPVNPSTPTPPLSVAAQRQRPRLSRCLELTAPLPPSAPFTSLHALHTALGHSLEEEVRVRYRSPSQPSCR